MNYFLSLSVPAAFQAQPPAPCPMSCVWMWVGERQVSFMVLILGCRLAKNKEEKEGKKKKRLKILISGLAVNKGEKNDI